MSNLILSNCNTNNNNENGILTGTEKYYLALERYYPINDRMGRKTMEFTQGQ